jgi:hypothetical protein
MYGLGASVVLVFAIAMSLPKSITSRIVTETKLIETGCRFGSNYSVEYNIGEITAKYYPKPKKEGLAHHIYLEHPGRRTIQVYVNDQNAPALVRIAPETMRQVAMRMRQEGQDLPLALWGVLATPP